MPEISEITVNSTVYRIRDRNYTICSTDASIAAKTAVLEGFTLVTGATVRVKFINSNTASSPTLNINGTGAKVIKIYGTISAGTTTKESWYDGSIITFVYDGANWVMSDYAVRDNPNIECATASVPANGTIYLNLNTGSFVFLASDRGGLWTKTGYNRAINELVHSDKFVVTAESNTKIKIVYSHAYSAKMMAISDLGCWFSSS